LPTNSSSLTSRKNTKNIDSKYSHENKISIHRKQKESRVNINAGVYPSTAGLQTQRKTHTSKQYPPLCWVIMNSTHTYSTSNLYNAVFFLPNFPNSIIVED
jgi:hypothetical protein